MSYSGFMDNVYLAAERLVAFFDDVAVLCNWHDFVSIFDDVENRDAGFGQGGELGGLQDEAWDRLELAF